MCTLYYYYNDEFVSLNIEICMKLEWCCREHFHTSGNNAIDHFGTNIPEIKIGKIVDKLVIDWI